MSCVCVHSEEADEQPDAHARWVWWNNGDKEETFPIACDECCRLVKKDAAGKYFPQTGIGGYTYELMTDEKELQQVKIIKGLQTDETVVTIKRED